MPFVLIPVAMYVAYKHQQSSELEEIDPAIDLEGLSCIRFLTMEVEKAGMLESPITTVSFYNGNYKDVAPLLKERVDSVLKANPWLGGWIAKISGDKHFRLFYDASGERRAPGSFTLFDSGQVALAGHKTPYADYEGIMEQAELTVKRNKQQFGRNSSLWRISLIPDTEEPESRFALVVSMSHLAGDGHTFYKLYSMLSSETDVVSLNPVRRFDAVDTAKQLMGAEEYHYITKAISNPLWEWTQAEGNPCENCIFIISKYWLEILRLEHCTSSENEHADETRVSDNSLITWWFFNLTRPTVGFMSYNLRKRVQGLNDLTAGNYNNPICYTETDYATPQLIQQSLKPAKRCGSDPPAPLPGFQWDATFSLITNWATFYKSSIQLGEAVEVLHMPLQMASEMKLVPSKLSLMCLFTVQEGRLGAFINAPRSIMKEVEASGIIDKVITKF